MKWNKLGHLYKTGKNCSPYLISHASNPLPIHIKNNIYRIFFSGRDELNRSSIGFVDIDIIKLEIISECEKSILVFDIKDSFYSHGISIGNAYQQKQNNYILFMGWNIQNNEHWKGSIGRIELMDNYTMQVNPTNPFFDLDDEDPISLSYPFVTFHNGIYKMWYGSTIKWEAENGEMIHVIKYATSNDGENWLKHGIAIPYEIGVAQAFSKPTVIIDEIGFHMWYSYRSGSGTKYRIGYAHSVDGIKWVRAHEKVGITVSKTGWDSEMMCYPFVFNHNHNQYMLYNGNEYGKYGFGIAILEK